MTRRAVLPQQREGTRTEKHEGDATVQTPPASDVRRETWDVDANVPSFCVEPDEGIHLRFEAKAPGAVADTRVVRCGSATASPLEGMPYRMPTSASY